MLVFILGAALLCMLALILIGRKARLNLVWLSLAVLTAAAACALTVTGLQKGVVYSRFSSEPEETVRSFFDSLLAGRYGEACACLDNYTDLGMDAEPEDPAAAELYDALRASYAYELAGEARTEGLSAVQELSFTALDVTALQADLRQEVLANLARYVEERPYHEVYDENDSYRSEVSEEAYREAVSALLAHSADDLRTETLSLSLHYGESGWRLSADAALLNALNGFTSR